MVLTEEQVRKVIEARGINLHTIPIDQIGCYIENIIDDYKDVKAEEFEQKLAEEKENN